MALKSYEIVIDGFKYRSDEVPDDVLLDIAGKIVRGFNSTFPPIEQLKRVYIIGYAKGTRNLERYANNRAYSVLGDLLHYVDFLGKGDYLDIINIGKPVTSLVSSNSQVAGTDRKVVIRVEWKKKNKKAERDQRWVDSYYDRSTLPRKWVQVNKRPIKIIGALTTPKYIDIKVAPAALWKKKMKNAPLSENFQEYYLGFLELLNMQREPNLHLSPSRERENFHARTVGRFDVHVKRRINIREIEEFLLALYTSKPDFGSGPNLRRLRYFLREPIAKYQSAVIARVSQDKSLRVGYLLGPEQLKPVAAGLDSIGRQSMVKNALSTALSTVITVNRYDLPRNKTRTAKYMVKNCGVTISYAVNEHNASLAKDKKITNYLLDSVAVIASLAPAGSLLYRTTVKTVFKELVNAASASKNIRMDRIKVTFERGVNNLLDKGTNPSLTDDIATDLIQEFHDGCDISIN